MTAPRRYAEGTTLMKELVAAAKVAIKPKDITIVLDGDFPGGPNND